MDLPPYENPYASTNPTLTVEAAGPDEAAAKALVKAPAMILMILSIISIVFSVISILFYIFGLSMAGIAANSPSPADQEFVFQMLFQGVGGIITQSISIAIYVFFIFGCKKMMNLESKGVVWTMLILAVIPCCSPCCIGLPFGIWGIVVMNDPIVKVAFKS